MPSSPAGAVLDPIGLTRLVLTDFRSYAALRLETTVAPVVITGANGLGKTNLLEAVSFLAPGRGLRRAKLSDVTRHEAAGGPSAGWGVVATVQGPQGLVEIATGRPPGEADRRVVRINGKAARSQAELGDHVTAVWLTPAMDRLFQEGASGRRRFLDRLVYGLDPAHAGRLSAYEKAQRQRAKVLREGGAAAWLTALEEIMAAQGVPVAVSRLDMVQRLEHALAEADGPFPGAQLSLDGALEDGLGQGLSPAEAEAQFRDSLAAARGRERAGAPTEGPLRTDLRVIHGGRQRPAVQCSTGEQKAVLIALLLAQARVQAAVRGMAPLLLFDEVAAHLDERHRHALFAALSDLGAQAWLTGTDRLLFAGLEGRAQFLDPAALSSRHTTP